MRVVTAAEMRAIDQQARELYGLPELVLMENAGLRVVEVATDRYGNPADLAIAVICGKGNNGGDGLVAARHFHNAGADVIVYLVADPESLTESARVNYDIYTRIGGRTELVPPDPVTNGTGRRGSHARSEEPLAKLAADLQRADLVVDALLGTGVSGEVTGALAAVIDAVNQAGRPVIAVDIPSGVNADTGQVCGAAVRADVTITFGAPKPGCLLHPGAGLAGELVTADISLPGALLAAPGELEVLAGDEVAPLLPHRAPTAHKGDAGRLAIVAGSVGFTGAAALAAEAAVRTGAGLVTVLTPSSVQPLLAAKLTEPMTVAGAQTEAGQLAAKASEQALQLADKADAVAVGPGLGASAGVRTVVQRLLAQPGAPIVLDADALNVIAGEPEGAAAALARTKRDVVVTPHPGEMARLTGRSIEHIEADRIGAARDLAAAARCCVVLKGAPTVVANASGAVWLNSTGNSGMASGGMGDVLTGVISSLIAQGLAADAAARAGVFLHGLAGDIAAEEIGDIGYLARDVIALLPAARQRLLAAAQPR